MKLEQTDMKVTERMIKEQKKQLLYTFGMMILSFIPVAAAHSYQKVTDDISSKTAKLTEHVLADIQEISRINQETRKRMKEAEMAPIAEELLAAEEEKPKPDALNMACYFAEGADTSDASQSYAAKVFDELTSLDESWTSNIYQYLQRQPASAATSLGIAADPRIQELDSFEEIQMQVTDGDGKRISLYSNASAIMSLASVYTYYHNPEDYDAFLKYCKKLWEASHSYTVGISDVYFCDGTCESEETAADIATASDIATTSDAAENATPSDAESTDDMIVSPCQGHVDLNVHMKITGIDGNSNLFRIDPIGNKKEDQETLTASWSGWNEQTMAQARSLYEKDWYESYGLSASSIALGNPLSLSEIEDTMRSLPQDLSETRKNIVRFALESVGKVPYYYGGKASRAGYEGNHFGSLISEDQNGRILKGLDCSGWVGWVYWTAVGMEMPYATTVSLSSAGREIDQSELKPGDILVRTGKNAHVVMFLNWTEHGQMRCIHESSTAANNVIISDIRTSFPIFRRLLDD